LIRFGYAFTPRRFAVVAHADIAVTPSLRRSAGALPLILISSSPLNFFDAQPDVSIDFR